MSGANVALIVLSSILFTIVTLPILANLYGNTQFNINRGIIITNGLLTLSILVCSIFAIADYPADGANIAILILSFILLTLFYFKYKRLSIRSSILLGIPVQMLKWIICFTMLILSVV